ncbi:hypothetical protein [Lacibacter sediminis]|uniref:Uncharacterized protein n=1 Tax=Lacibacter sediminis TaxID=2760713 RepID=A0A7G5XIC3_9BACT|nr:hypothetical protein [Lacibacter sediminis]QNA45226.1 hypothetical protein H4075_03210 [Lacibacter sediminis]
MKIILTGLVFICCTSFLQTGKYPVVKLYAYQQKVSGGANFSSKEKGRSTLQQYVYLLVRNGRSITVDEVWIAGQSVSFKTEETKAPVTIENSIKLGNTPATETLVPETTHTVMQIVFTNEAAAASNSPSRYRNYPLLIKYIENGRTYYLGTKNWTVLNPKVNQ